MRLRANPAMAEMTTLPPVLPTPQRVDQWLFFARIVKSRTLAAELVNHGKLRINRDRVLKPATPVKPGDVLTLALPSRVRVLKVLGSGARRGPAVEAQLLYEDLAPPLPQTAADPSVAEVPRRDPGAGRPSRQERRQMDRAFSPRHDDDD